MSVLVILSAIAATLAVHAAPKAPATIYEFKMKDIDGKEVSLDKYKGKVLLVVNVASFCGNTPQYAGLEEMYKKYNPKGFTVLGFPANEFGAQEPGTNAEIKEFCTATYHVDFPMFSKIVVKGEGIHPLYQWLLAGTEHHQDVEWNFTKFLVGRDGKVAGRFSHKTKPDNPELVGAIEAAIAAKG
jgi:glutathione peroxidase